MAGLWSRRRNRLPCVWPMSAYIGRDVHFREIEVALYGTSVFQRLPELASFESVQAAPNVIGWEKD